MTSTAVKDVRSMFLNQAAPAAGKAGSDGGAFQKVWNSQMNKGTWDSSTSHDSTPDKVSAQQSYQENGAVQKDEGGVPEEKHPVEQTDSVASPEEQEALSGEKNAEETEPGVTQGMLHAMEVLGTAAAQLLEQIAGAFGVTVEELQAVMDSMGMGQADLLDPSMLGNLLLELGGAQDVYALLTDGALYDKYQMIMGQQGQALREIASELGTEPGQLPGLLKDGMQAVQEDIPAEAGLGTVKSPEEGLPLEGEGEPTDADGGSLQNTKMAAGPVAEEQAPKQEAGQQGGKQPEGGAARGEQMNLFAQGLRAEQFQPQLQQMQEAAPESPWSAETTQIMDQILDYMKLSLNADTTSLEMQLHPASLGTLQVQIASKGGVVTANFIAQNEAVKAALESQMIQLREQFEEQGVKIEAIEVTVQTHEFEQNLEQGRGRSQQGSEKRSRGRRITLGGTSVAEEPGAEGTPEDALLAAGESTVNFRA